MINANVRSPGYLLSAYGAWFAGRIAAHARCLVRFGLVGASGVVVNTALLYVLIEVGGLNHLVAALLATEAAILSRAFGSARTPAYTRPRISKVASPWAGTP